MINWLLQKTVIRVLIFTIVSIVSLLVVIAIFSPNSFKNGFSMFGLVALLSAYNLFWFVLSCVINIKVNNSAKNALTLIGLWLLIVIVLPASINQIGNSLYPVPSRLKMINEIRLIKKENESSQNKIMDEYLRNHPELALKSDKDNFGFWHNYFASEKVMEEKTKPILVEFEGQLKKQQDLISMFKYLSPAIVIQQSLNNLAGTSEKHYNDYKKQVFEFSDKWRNYLAPMLFNNQKFTIKNYNEMPVFNYENRIKNNIWLSAIILVFTSAIVFFLFNSKRLKNKSAQQFMD
jgi:ABC-2 type transport system permease protein